MQSKNSRTIGIAWYTRDTYAEVRGVMDDAHLLPRGYESWLRTARSVVEREHARGSDIVKAMIEPDAFMAWCQATGQCADIEARTRHVNLAVEEYWRRRWQRTVLARVVAVPESPAQAEISRS